ncbi:hypothetical protein [Rathayibacter sp. AY1B5]|uniref:hypothetical protein n=1 Tax=Rathayibacter sp. AY1B5 TaxID=2080530 RepID=UPI000CE811ED|nr:hypothetical protein [Rathayibacter sp. AY1B5]PPI28195.1 hypothetical protein C5D44_00200 [Rathayibacter sp. AY1B5]
MTTTPQQISATVDEASEKKSVLDAFNADADSDVLTLVARGKGLRLQIKVLKVGGMDVPPWLVIELQSIEEELLSFFE